MKISLIVPCYNEQEALPIFYRETKKVMESMDCDYEMIFVNDGSKDGTLELLKEFAKEDTHVTYIGFSRNFGKEAAMYAGFCNVTGDYAAVMDADMQDPPSLLPQMLDILENQGYDSVATRRATRKGEPVIRSWFARMFYRLINKISDADIVDGARDFRLMKRSMVDAIVEMGEYNRFSKGIFQWVGFETKWIEYENVDRAAGNTKWSFSGLLRYAVNGFMSFATAPLRGAIYLGFIVMIVALVYGIYIVLNMLISGGVKSGYSSIMFAILFIGSIIILLLGIIGEYLARIYMEVKNRPIYIAKDERLDENTELKD